MNTYVFMYVCMYIEYLEEKKTVTFAPIGGKTKSIFAPKLMLLLWKWHLNSPYSERNWQTRNGLQSCTLK